MRTWKFVFIAIVLLLIARSTASAQSATASSVKVGVYDSRSIAVAWATSSFNPVGEKMKEFQAAKEAGDEAKAKELETWGAQHQRMLHFQGFGRVPVTELLEPIQAQLQQLAADMGLSAIAMACDFSAPGVEVVDVTEKIVDFYNPSEQARKNALGIRQQEPISLLELADMPDDH